MLGLSASQLPGMIPDDMFRSSFSGESGMHRRSLWLWFCGVELSEPGLTGGTQLFPSSVLVLSLLVSMNSVVGTKRGESSSESGVGKMVKIRCCVEL